MSAPFACVTRAVFLTRGGLGWGFAPIHAISKNGKISEFSIFAKFCKFLAGCIKTKFCKKICVRQHFSSSTRFASFCTAAISIFYPFPPPLHGHGPAPRRMKARGRANERQGSFSAVSKPHFATKYSLESSRRDLHNTLLCTALQSHFFVKI